MEEVNDIHWRYKGQDQVSEDTENRIWKEWSQRQSVMFEQYA